MSNTMPELLAPPPSIITYPMRPKNGGKPLPEAWADLYAPRWDRYAFEPKVNGWRALIHAPTGTIWNRQGQRSSIQEDFAAPLATQLEKEIMEKPDNQPLNQREQAALVIMKNPENYKVCGGCDSLISHRARICPNCHAYRFDPSPEAVIKQPDLLSRRAQNTVTPDDLT